MEIRKNEPKTGDRKMEATKETGGKTRTERDDDGSNDGCNGIR